MAANAASGGAGAELDFINVIASMEDRYLRRDMLY